MLDFIIKNYSKEIDDKKIVIFNYDNLKKIDDLSKLLGFLNIYINKDMRNYFNQNFMFKNNTRNEKFKKKVNSKEFLYLSKLSII